MTEEAIAPLDAYETAKEGEPTFTLQGGDPLAGPLVRLWAYLARMRAGVALLNGLAPRLVELQDTIEVNDLEHDEQERTGLLVRATAAEQVSWDMDSYRAGNHHADQPVEVADIHLDELQRIDLHDLKVRIAQKLSNFSCELLEMREALSKAGYDNVDDGAGNLVVMSDLLLTSEDLKLLNEMIEPRRLFKKD